MIEIENPGSRDKHALYESLESQARSLLDGERDPIANAANLAALIFHILPDLNWAGFYFLRDNTLLVGPFQGKPACVRIEMGRGVCGEAAAQKKTLLVEDVDRFPGHIPCDADSRSEAVVPLLSKDGGHLLGVLDLDSPSSGRFDEVDARGLERLAAIYTESLI
ncbi:MAG: GAF domain-containing protein [Gammaproteobacteria bacterium]